MQNIFINIFDLFFPECCLNCDSLIENKGFYLCFSCLSELPITGFSELEGNELEKSFHGRIPIVAGTSLLFFRNKGMVQNLIHHLKYRQKAEIGIFLGRWLAKEMLRSKRFKDIDCVIPVPLHLDKLKKRGYNQVHHFAETLSQELKVDCYKKCLIKTKNRETQTQKSRLERVNTKENEYVIQNLDRLKDKHILLVDDVITSGATIQACADSLLQVSGLSLSIASMAYTL